MGKGKPRKIPREEKEASDSEISVEEGDIEAIARSSLKAGESILGQGQETDAPVESRGICNAPVILQKLEEIEYTVPKDAKRVPWVDTLLIDGHKEVPKDVKAKDGVKLEGAFVDIATEAAKEAYRRFRVMKIPASRPTDFYAEMLRTDSQMFKVRERASEEQRRIKIVEDRKAAQLGKKYQKNVRSKKLQDKAGEKKKTLEEISEWRQTNKDNKRNADDADLDDILDKQGKGEGRRKDLPKMGAKREGLNKKWGNGGKKKRSKQNDATSMDDMSRSPWEKSSKGKSKGGGGKSKGKGGGGKGKGKGKKK